MPIKTIYSFLTYARKGKPDDTVVSGTVIPPDEGKLCKMLGTMFNNAHKECSIPIMFSSENGVKVNGVRDELMRLIDAPSLEAAKVIAIRLQKAMTGNSGMGLLFISIGDDGAAQRLVVSRFPADDPATRVRLCTGVGRRPDFLSDPPRVGSARVALRAGDKSSSKECFAVVETVHDWCTSGIRPSKGTRSASLRHSVFL